MVKTQALETEKLFHDAIDKKDRIERKLDEMDLENRDFWENLWFEADFAESELVTRLHELLMEKHHLSTRSTNLENLLSYRKSLASLRFRRFHVQKDLGEIEDSISLERSTRKEIGIILALLDQILKETQSRFDDPDAEEESTDIINIIKEQIESLKREKLRSQESSDKAKERYDSLYVKKLQVEEEIFQLEILIDLNRKRIDMLEKSRNSWDKDYSVPKHEQHDPALDEIRLGADADGLPRDHPQAGGWLVRRHSPSNLVRLPKRPVRSSGPGSLNPPNAPKELSV